VNSSDSFFSPERSMRDSFSGDGSGSDVLLHWLRLGLPWGSTYLKYGPMESFFAGMKFFFFFPRQDASDVWRAP